MAFPKSLHRVLILSLVIIPLILTWAGCASAPPPQNPALPVFSEAELAGIRQVFVRIDEQNRTVKTSPEWIERAYRSLNIRNYRSLDPAAVQQLRSFVQGNEVYIIVHPAYYTFFMHNYDKPPHLAEDPAAFPQLNLTDRLRLALPKDQFNYRVMWEEEQIVRDFLEYMSVKKRLVLLVLPHDYKNTSVYHSPRGLDEYARFINEVTNMADSTLYLESQTWDTGVLSQADIRDLHAFLSSLGVTKVHLGGGYVGKCLDNCYASLREVYSYSDIDFVPELTTISPRDMPDKLKLLTKDGRLNMRAVRRYFDRVGFTMSDKEEKMPLKDFALYPIYQVR